MKVPRSREQAELEKVPRGEKPEIEERIFKPIISQEHEEACWFWRGGCRDEVDYSTWDQDGPSPVASPPCRADSPGIIYFAKANALAITKKARSSVTHEPVALPVDRANRTRLALHRRQRGSGAPSAAAF